MNAKFDAFLAEKSISKEQYAEKSAEETVDLYNEFNEASAKVLEDLIAEKSEANADAIEALKATITEGRVEQMKTMNETLKQYGLQIKKLTDAEKAEHTPVNSVLKALGEQAEVLKEIKEGGSKKLSLKVAATITSANISGGNVPVEQRLAGVDTIASRRTSILDIVSRGVASSNLISWVSQANKDGAAGQTGEGLVKNQIDFDLVVTNESLKKTTAFIKVSTEMIDDVDFLNTEINNELMREVRKEIESQVLTGDAIGNNHNGINTIASAISAGTFALTVDNANVVDVLRVAMTNIETADHDPANYILLNPIDVTALMLMKVTTTDKRYIDALQVIAGQLMLDGVPILKSNLVTVGEYTVGNFANATLWDKGEVSVEIGLDADDFTKNLVTVLAEYRGLTIVKTNVRSSFVTGVIATDAALLETA